MRYGGGSNAGHTVAVNGEEYKHWSEKSLRELPQPEIWSRWYLREFGLAPETLAPFAEELSFYYDRERVVNTPRPRLRETLLTKLGTLSAVSGLSTLTR